VAADGTFQFPHVPPGSYIVSLYPPTPGIASVPVKVGNDDVTGLELVPLPTHTVKGRLVSKNGPLPRGLLAFITAKTYVGAKIASDGSFTAQLHSATHQIDLAGLPVGYSLASVKIGAVDATRTGVRVANADISDIVITVNAPTHLAK